MDRLLRKFSSKYKRAQEEVDKWREMQSQFLALLGNAITILERFPVIYILNFGVLIFFGCLEFFQCYDLHLIVSICLYPCNDGDSYEFHRF